MELWLWSIQAVYKNGAQKFHFQSVKTAKNSKNERLNAFFSNFCLLCSWNWHDRILHLICRIKILHSVPCYERILLTFDVIHPRFLCFLFLINKRQKRNIKYVHVMTFYKSTVGGKSNLCILFWRKRSIELFDYLLNYVKLKLVSRDDVIQVNRITIILENFIKKI
jgi:hypothetical protein